MTDGRSNPKPWTDADLEMLARDYPTTETQVLADRLGRPIRSLYAKARELKVYKTKAYMTGQLGRVRDIGHRFEVGNRPHNAGVKGWNPGGNFKKTQFKKGSRPHNYKPVGTERVSMYDLVQRKVADTGDPKQDWIPVHILLWNEHYGEVLKDHLVVFSNGNKRDFRIENLEMISRVENMRRNSIQNYPEDIRKAIRLVGRLKRKINEKQD